MSRLWWGLVPVVVAAAVYLRLMRPVATITPDGSLWVDHDGPVVFREGDSDDLYCHVGALSKVDP